MPLCEDRMAERSHTTSSIGHLAMNAGVLGRAWAWSSTQWITLTDAFSGKSSR
jgi:hypothetical protein